MDCSPVLQPAASATVICIVQATSVWPVAAVIVSAIAASLAIWNIRSARELARKKATLDLIEKVESSEHYRTLTDSFSIVRDSGSFAHFVKPTDEASRRTRGHIVDYLNHYELVAIGIRQKILDAGIYRAWMEKAFVRDWNAAAGWVQALRTRVDAAGNPTGSARAYANYASTAAAWSARRWSSRQLQRDPADTPAAIILTAQSAPLIHVDAPQLDSKRESP